jgi:hypothetical protein
LVLNIKDADIERLAVGRRLTAEEEDAIVGFRH